MKKTALVTATLYCELHHQILILDTTQELDITRLMDILGKIANLYLLYYNDYPKY